MHRQQSSAPLTAARVTPRPRSPSSKAASDLAAPHANYTPWTPATDLIEAYVRAGSSADAAQAVRALDPPHPSSMGTRRPRSRTRTHRKPVRVRPAAPSLDRLFRSPRRPLRGGRQPALLRRAATPRRPATPGARTAARCLAAFERMHVERWAERVGAELRASGETLRAPRDRAAIDELTRQERRVALTVAGGPGR